MYKDSNPKNDWGVIKTDDFKTNLKSDKRFTVIDNFYEKPLELREFALQQWFHDDAGYLGIRTRKQFLFKGVKEKFENALGKKITKWEGYEMNGRFQSHKDQVGNVFNRCVIWDAGLLHAAPTYFGWDVASSRLSQVFFFDTSK